MMLTGCPLPAAGLAASYSLLVVGNT